jgi:hypothetical protein
VSDRGPALVSLLSRSFSCLVGLYHIVQWYATSNPFQCPRPFDSSKPESHDTSHAVSPPPARSRLNLTLAGNELRYQAVMRERKAAIQKIGGPNALSCDSTLCR